MPSKPGYEALRQNRVSISSATYFVTICTETKAPGLTEAIPAECIRTQLNALETDKVLTTRAAVIMPDHLHVFFRITGTLSIGQIIGRLKSKTKPALALSGLRWQGNFYEHRLRDGDLVEEVLRYMFLNPYHAGIEPADSAYPHFWLGSKEAKWFPPTLGGAHPFPD